VKRFIDFWLVVASTPLLLPLFFLVMLIVRLKLGTPVFFSQVRAGQLGASFKMFKFRTMTDERDAEGNLIEDEKRLTRFGKFLRSTSLDELPSLWSVLKGDMSLVGPRPLLVEYLPLYSEKQSRRHEVRPGITGWAKVNGRNTVSWNEKFDLDVWYVDNQSIWLDIKILWLAVQKVIVRDGITTQDDVTMPIFRGLKK